MRKTCEWCGGVYVKRTKEAYWQFEERRFCSKSCATSARNHKTDQLLSPSTRYRQGRLSHRTIMEHHLGRKLLPTEYVHHINGDKLDNRIGNLEVVTAAQHGLRHTTLPRQKSCVICGAIFVPHKTKRRRKQTCSSGCKSLLISRRTKEGKAKAALAIATLMGGD